MSAEKKHVVCWLKYQLYYPTYSMISQSYPAQFLLLKSICFIFFCSFLCTFSASIMNFSAFLLVDPSRPPMFGEIPAGENTKTTPERFALHGVGVLSLREQLGVSHAAEPLQRPQFSWEKYGGFGTWES